MSQDTSTATAAPTPVVTTSTPAPAAPVVDATDGLAAAVAAHAAGLRVPSAPPPPAAGTNIPAEVALLESSQTATPTTEAPADPAPVEEPAKVEPPKPPEDATAATLAKYIRQDRMAREATERANRERAAATAERKAIEAERAERAKEQDIRALAKTDPVAAVKALVDDATLRGSFVVDLINRLGDGTAVELTEEQKTEIIAKQAETRVLAKLKADEEAAAAKRAEQEKTQNAAGKEAFFVGLQAQFEANAGSYPFLEADPVPTPEMDSWIESQFIATRRIPSPDVIFKHFDGQREAKAARLLAAAQKRAGSAQATPAPAPEETTTERAPAPLAVDSRGKPSMVVKPTSFREERDRIAAALDRR